MHLPSSRTRVRCLHFQTHICASHLSWSMILLITNVNSILNIYTEYQQIEINIYTSSLCKNCSRALPLHSYRSRVAESPYSRSDENGSHRTPAWKLIILGVEKIDLVQQNDFPHRIIRYLTYTCVLYSYENTLVAPKIEKFRKCTYQCFILAA